MEEMKSKRVELQVLVAAYGEAGIARVAEGRHPAVEGVEYLIGWQTKGVLRPDELLGRYEFLTKREDIKILPHDSEGVSRNRNYLLEHATAPLALLSDDDVDYSEEQLPKVIKAFAEHKDYGFITFRYDTAPQWRKHYPGSGDFDLRHPPRFYYSGAIEMAFRVEAVRRAGVCFNEHFGFGKDEFLSGEDTVFMHSVLRKGIRGLHVASTICYHRGGASTSRREGANPRFIESKGAIAGWLHPFTWPLRMVAEARRQSVMPAKEFITAWVRGMVRARRRHTFCRRKGY